MTNNDWGALATGIASGLNSAASNALEELKRRKGIDQATKDIEVAFGVDKEKAKAIAKLPQHLQQEFFKSVQMNKQGSTDRSALQEFIGNGEVQAPQPQTGNSIENTLSQLKPQHYNPITQGQPLQVTQNPQNQEQADLAHLANPVKQPEQGQNNLVKQPSEQRPEIKPSKKQQTEEQKLHKALSRPGLSLKGQEAIMKAYEKKQDRILKEQEGLEKKYKKDLEKIQEDTNYAETSDAPLHRQAELVIKGQMPSPYSSALIEFGKKPGAAIGGLIGGLGGAAIGSLAPGLGTAAGAISGAGAGAYFGKEAIPGVDLTALLGDDASEFAGLNVDQYNGAQKIFRRLTENEFKKYEEKLPRLTDTDEVKIRKINNALYRNERARIINQAAEQVKEDNGGLITNRFNEDVRKKAKANLDELEKEFKAGTFGYNLKKEQAKLKKESKKKQQEDLSQLGAP